jgi:hypothetical protein
MVLTGDENRKLSSNIWQKFFFCGKKEWREKKQIKKFASNWVKTVCRTSKMFFITKSGFVMLSKNTFIKIRKFKDGNRVFLSCLKIVADDIYLM